MHEIYWLGGECMGAMLIRFKGLSNAQYLDVEIRKWAVVGGVVLSP